MASTDGITYCITMLCEAFKHKPTAMTFETYAEVLADVPDDVLRDACNRLMRSEEVFLPTPGNLLSMCRKVSNRFLAQGCEAWERYVKMGDSDELADEILPTLSYCPHTADWYTLGRREFIQAYTKAMRSADGKLTKAVKYLDAPDDSQ